MTPRKKTSLLSIGAYAGAAISCLLLVGMVYASLEKRLNDRIDIRIECRTKYMETLMKEMATPEQKERADKEFRRWEQNK